MNAERIDEVVKTGSGDKKATRVQVRAIDVDEFLDLLDVEELGLKRCSVILLALARIVARKLKFLLEDCSHALQVVVRARQIAVRTVRLPSSKPVTLGLDSGNLYIDDNMLDYEDEIIFPREGSSLLEASFADDNFEINFGDLPAVEQVRDSTLVNSSTFVPAESTFVIKKRRVHEDSTREYDLDAYKSSIRSIRDILAKEQKDVLRERLCSTLEIDSRLLSALQLSAKRPEEPVEHQRQTSFDNDFLDNDFSMGPADSMPQQSLLTDRSLLSETRCLFELVNLPLSFFFESIVADYSGFDRAFCFSRLLEMASKNELEVLQEEPFATIECKQTK